MKDTMVFNAFRILLTGIPDMVSGGQWGERWRWDKVAELIGGRLRGMASWDWFSEWSTETALTPAIREATFPVFHWNGESWREHQEVISILGPFLWLRPWPESTTAKEFCYFSKLPGKPHTIEMSLSSQKWRLSASCNLQLTSHDGVKQLCLSDQDNTLLKTKTAYEIWLQKLN